MRLRLRLCVVHLRQSAAAHNDPSRDQHHWDPPLLSLLTILSSNLTRLAVVAC